IDVVLVGEDLNRDYILKLASKIEREIKRKVNFTISAYFDDRGLILFENN
ncbi:MAG: ArsR family transcriptional regulator, partial [Flavobacteriaceae bacterium]|nr:ArsR family transcriptional regulator [Flavobacteriaceae bacterium]